MNSLINVTYLLSVHFTPGPGLGGVEGRVKQGPALTESHASGAYDSH